MSEDPVQFFRRGQSCILGSGSPHIHLFRPHTVERDARVQKLFDGGMPSTDKDAKDVVCILEY